MAAPKKYGGKSGSVVAGVDTFHQLVLQASHYQANSDKMHRQGRHAGGYQPTDSERQLAARLKQASLNSERNKTIHHLHPKTETEQDADIVYRRPFLQTESDEDQELIDSGNTGVPHLLKHRSLVSSATTHLTTYRHTENLTEPPIRTSSSNSTTAKMDRKLRQNKPRLLLMGQRR
jgi:hypothetical protein